MVGREHPILAMEHMYSSPTICRKWPAINKATGKEVLHAVDFDGELVFAPGTRRYVDRNLQKACKPWAEHETPWSFGHELLEPDFDRIVPSLEVAFRHFPAFQTAGIRKIVNGPSLSLRRAILSSARSAGFPDLGAHAA